MGKRACFQGPGRFPFHMRISITWAWRRRRELEKPLKQDEHFKWFEHGNVIIETRDPAWLLSAERGRRCHDRGNSKTPRQRIICGAFHVALGLRTRLRLLLLIRQNHAHTQRNETFLCLSLDFSLPLCFWKVKDWDLDCSARQQTIGSACFQLRHENWLDFGPKCLSNLKRFLSRRYKWCQINLTMSPCVNSKAVFRNLYFI